MTYRYHPPRSDEAAWAAGIFEGEGTISTSTRKGRTHALVELKVAMTDQDVVLRLREIFDCGTTRGPYTRDENKPYWIWSVSKQADVVHILARLLPYLGRRRKRKALQALASVTPRLTARTA